VITLITNTIRLILGPLSAVLDYSADHPFVWTTILLVWILIYVSARIQLKLIELKTTDLVVKHCRLYISANPDITPTDLYNRIFPIWTSEMKQWGYLFILHKHDLWPVKATLENVQVKIPFSPKWITATMEKKGIMGRG